MFRVRSLALLSAVVALSGCYRWSAPSSPATPMVMRTWEGTMEVTPRKGPVFRLLSGRITGDTLRGYERVSFDTNRSVFIYRTVAMPLAEVRSVSRREFSVGATAVVVTLVSGGIVALAVAASGFHPGVGM